MARASDEDPARDAGHRRLLAHITNHTDHGRRVPCVEPSTKNWWTSENTRDQHTAAWSCRGCPALDACHTYVSAHPERAGTWAALTPGERARRDP